MLSDQAVVGSYATRPITVLDRRGDNVKMTLVKYRTKDVSHNLYAVVPISWASDLMDWLVISEAATIVGKTDNVGEGAIIPSNWPYRRLCLDHMKISDLLSPVR